VIKENDMFITHSYIGAVMGKFRCLFFLLIEDYIEEQTQFMKELEIYFEKFARDLKETVPLWRPFKGDIERTRDEFLRRNWGAPERLEIEKTPAIFMINVDFREFDPQIHPWFHLSFGHRSRDHVLDVDEVGAMLGALAKIVRESDQDIFEAATRLKNEIRLSDATGVFEAKPGIFGFTFDLKKGADLAIKAFI
jgi:hypothetical protein